MNKLSVLSLLVVVLLLSSCKSAPEEVSTQENKVEAPAPKSYHGIVTKQSFVDVKTTMDRLENIIAKKKGIQLFSRINHAQNSRNAGAENVADSELIIFGNPAVGLQMISKDPKSGLDLPLKILAYQDKDGKVYVTYRAVSFYSEIYNLENCEAKDKMNAAITKMSDIIIKSPEDFKLFLEKSKSKKQ